MDMKTNAEEMEKWLNLPIPKRVINEWKKENKLKIKTEKEKIRKKSKFFRKKLGLNNLL